MMKASKSGAAAFMSCVSQILPRYCHFGDYDFEKIRHYKGNNLSYNPFFSRKSIWKVTDVKGPVLERWKGATLNTTVE